MGYKQLRPQKWVWSIGAPLLSILSVLVWVLAAHAANTMPSTMNFQGRLTDASGNIVANGSYNVKFTIYNAGSTAIWTETRETTNRVVVTNGLFSVQMGSVTALTPSLFNTTGLTLGVTLATPATATCSTAACQVWETEMAPRSPISTSAYAFNSDTLDGLDATAFGQLNTANSWVAAQTVNIASASAFAVTNGSTNLLKADTTNSQVVVGASDTTAALLVLDTKTNSGDPSAVAGGMYYNSNSGKMRCSQGGTWVDCVSTPTLQNVYDNSSPATIATTAAKSVSIAASAAPTVDLFTVSNAGQGTNTSGVNAIGVTYAGGSTGSIEGSGIRVDYTPGNGASSTWNGLRIVSGNSSANTTNNGIKIEGPTTGNGTDTGLRVASGFDIGVDIQSGGLEMTGVDNTGEPGTIAAGDLRLYARTNAGRTMLKMKGGSGIDTTLQPFLGTNRIALFQPTFGSASITANTVMGTVIGLNHYTSGTTASTTATVSETTVGTASLFTSMKRTEIGTSTNASTVGDLRFATPQFFRGGAAGLGGFYAVGRFGVSTYRTGARVFAGMEDSNAALANADITTNTNILGFGCDTGATTMSFIYNDASGTASTVALGANYPCNTSDADVYEYRLFVAPNGSTVYYSLARLNTTDFIEGSVTTDIPTATTLLTPHFYIGNNTTALRAELDIMSMYVETDN